MTRQQKWDRRFIELAKHFSSWSKDPSTQVGSVIVDSKGRVVSMGYNGLPMGVEDKHERLHNRDIKYKMVVHGERNAIIFAQQSLEGCTLYTWPFMSCPVCAGMVIQAGIVRCVAPLNNNERWKDDFKITKQMFKEAGVKLTQVKGYFTK